MKRLVLSTALAAAVAGVAGCDSTPPQTVYLQANRLPPPSPPVVKEVPIPVAVPQFRLSDKQPAPATRPAAQIIESANLVATQKPTAEGFIQAVQTYDYVPGMVYQIVASPGHVTTILLKPGEQLVSKVAGDTAQWMIGDTHSGSGDLAQTLVLVKPLKPGLQTNLMLATSERVYQIDLQSAAGVYHSAVQWTYSADFARQVADGERQAVAEQKTTIAPALNLAALNFDYRIRAHGKAPPWMPLRVFTDGRKTYIGFPKDLDSGQAPPLFLLSSKGDAELVNYRQKDNYYVVDRVIDRAELRLGSSPQQIVSLERR